MKRFNKLVYLFAFLFIAGCSTGYDVIIPDSIEYETSELDACKYITKINDTKIRDFNREKGKIDEGDIHVTCPILEIKELGKQEVTISINSVETVLYFHMKDTTAPTLQIDKDILKVEENNEYFDLKKMVLVEDSYDHNPFIGYSGTYDLKVPGTYPVKISAKDVNKNETVKEVSIIVTKKKVEIVEKKVIVDSGGDKESTKPPVNNTSPHTTPIPPPFPPSTNQSSLPSKTFLFSDGFDIQTGFNACKAYRGSSSGSCSPLQDISNITYGYEYTP